MARNTSRMGLASMIATSVRTSLRPGSAGLIERVAAVPRMLSALMRGEYRGTTFGHIAMIGAAVFYIVSPLDIVPEALFGIFGLTDDAVVVTWLVAALINDTEAFLDWEHSAGRARTSAGPSQGWSGPQDWYARPQDMSAEQWAGQQSPIQQRTIPGHIIR